MAAAAWETDMGMIAYRAMLSSPNERSGPQEPEWLPRPEEIAKARRDLERSGATQWLRREPAAEPLVPPGEAPWPWLLACAAWLIVWPAVLALHFGSGRFPWLPWWLPVSAAALHMLVLAVPVIAAGQKGSRNALRRRFGRVQTLAQMTALEPEEFETWVGMLFTLRGFRVHNTQFSGDHGIDLEVKGSSVSRGLVQCKRYRGTVGEPVVRELYGTHVHENADFSWLATTGAISAPAREWAAGKPIELWDGQRLVELARRAR